MTVLHPALDAEPERHVPHRAEPARTGAPGNARRRAPSHVRVVVESGALGLLIGLAVVLPWMAGGYLVLLDWVSGPHDTLDPGVFGLSYAGMDALPWRLVTAASRDLLGPGVTGWLFVLLPFPVAAAGAAHLVGRGRWPSYAAALALTCTPLVVDRVGAGHVGFLLSIALLPWLATSALHARERQSWMSARVAGWYALSVAISPHAAWIGGVLLVAVTVSGRITLRDVVRLGVSVAAAAGVYAYAIAVLLVDRPAVSIGSADLEAFATKAGPGGLLPTVLTLHGFWRGGPGQVRDVLGPWWVLVAVAVLATIVLGLATLVRARNPLGRLALVLVGAGAVLAMGSQGPLGEVYALAFERLPLFAVMREPAKWLALVQLGYAIGFGAGVAAVQEWARRSDTRAPRAIGLVPVAAALVPLAVLPALAWGLGGQITTSTYPSSWAQVEQLTSGSRGALLALPWHGYQPYPFTGGRAVATPVSSSLSIHVLQSDSVELGPLRTNSTSSRQAAVDTWVAAGGSSDASMLVDLGVSYVLLTSSTESSSYAWVSRQRGLTLALHTDDLDLWSVDGRDRASTRVRHPSQALYVVDPGPAGRIVLPEEYADGWTMDGASGQRTPAGAVAFEVGTGRAEIAYAPWAQLRTGVLVSLAVLLALVVAGLVEHRNDVPFGRRARAVAR